MSNILKEKSENFSDRIIKMHDYLRRIKKERTISEQILRSGTSIGANIAEANFSGSKKDFINKLNIAAKECSETGFWLRRLKSGKHITESQYESMQNDCDEIGKLLTSSIKTAQRNVSKLNIKH